MHENLGKFIVLPTDKNVISPNIKWCNGKCPGLCSSKLAHGT